MRKYNIPPAFSSSLQLGRQGENGVTEITFLCAGYAKMYGDGFAEAVHRTPDGTIYPVNIEQDENNRVSWLISDGDTATAGTGQLELRWMVNGNLAKSKIFSTIIKSALTAPETPPDAAKSWVDKVLKAAEDIKGGITEQKAREIAQSVVDAYQEKDPTVPDWAKTETKPTYIAAEVGAVPESAKSDIDKNTSARHTHSNKSALDSISESDIAKWNSGTAGTVEITGATGLAAGSAPTVTEAADSTAQARKYTLGIPAGEKGADGAKGEKGENGTDGKSAYQFAQEAGYTGTESDFSKKLNQTTFANPFPLTFTGAASAAYDGSTAVTVDLPSGGASNKKNYVIPNTYDELVLTNTTTGYIQDNGTIVSVESYITSDYIDLDNYDYFRLVSIYAYNACGYVIFDNNKHVLSYVKDTKPTLKRIDIVPQDIAPTSRYIRFCGNVDSLHVYVKKQTTSITDGLEEVLKTGNVLYHKKIAFCGDSFTEASNLGKTLYDNFIGCYKSFGWRIADRNKMELYHDGISGSTMHVVNKENPSYKHPFAYERYKNVPADCDYIILQFGLNESDIANSDATKGTKDSTDTTTMWGAWNTALGYLIKNHPTARIGIIMSDAWMPQSYYAGLKEICEWWGIPLLDLGGDPNVPLMNGGRRSGSGLVLNPEVAELRNATFYNADGDAHPNDEGHGWRSTVIENWIRSL